MTTEKDLKCTTCGRGIANLKGSVILDCPNCEKQKIVRCFYCRRSAAKYACPACKFSGPN